MGVGNTAEIETGTVTVTVTRLTVLTQTCVNRSSDTKVVIGYYLQPSWSGAFKTTHLYARGVCSAAIEVVKWFH